MYTQDEFEEVWNNAHPSIHTYRDVKYFYDVYSEIYELLEYASYDKKKVNRGVMDILYYIEDMASLGLSKILMDEYRLSADAIEKTINAMELDENIVVDIKIIIYQAIKFFTKDSVNGLRMSVWDAFRSQDFERLTDILLWLTKRLVTLKAVLPNRDIIEANFDSELGTDGLPGKHEVIVDKWICFNWCDKKGRKLVELIKLCLEDGIKSAEDEELFNMYVCELDKYRIVEENDNGTLTIEPYNDPEWPSTIKEPKNVPVGFEQMYLFGILVDWGDDCFMCEPYIWMNGKAADNFIPEEFVEEIKVDLAVREIHSIVKLSTGKNIRLFDDLEGPDSFAHVVPMEESFENGDNEDDNASLDFGKEPKDEL